MKIFVVTVKNDISDNDDLDWPSIGQQIYYAVEDYIMDKSQRPHTYDIEVLDE